jgi:hypothetical protein
MLDERINQASSDMNLQWLAFVPEDAPRTARIPVGAIKTLAGGAPAPDRSAPGAP